MDESVLSDPYMCIRFDPRTQSWTFPNSLIGTADLALAVGSNKFGAKLLLKKLMKSMLTMKELVRKSFQLLLL